MTSKPLAILNFKPCDVLKNRNEQSYPKAELSDTIHRTAKWKPNLDIANRKPKTCHWRSFDFILKLKINGYIANKLNDKKENYDVTLHTSMS